jgi:hypothetical protein
MTQMPVLQQGRSVTDRIRRAESDGHHRGVKALAAFCRFRSAIMIMITYAMIMIR